MPEVYEQNRGKCGYVVMESMIANSRILLEKMGYGCKYTYRELLKLCELTETQLCFAIMFLLREGRISQYREADVVYELIPVRR